MHAVGFKFFLSGCINEFKKHSSISFSISGSQMTVILIALGNMESPFISHLWFNRYLGILECLTVTIPAQYLTIGKGIRSSATLMMGFPFTSSFPPSILLHKCLRTSAIRMSMTFSTTFTSSTRMVPCLFHNTIWKSSHFIPSLKSFLCCSIFPRESK